jgi:hypothetical protein
MAGCSLFAAGSIPLFQALTDYVQPQLREAQQRATITVVADPRYCSILFSPTGRAHHRTSCDVAKDFLTRAGLPFHQEGAASKELAGVQVGNSSRGYISSFPGQGLNEKDFQVASDQFARQMGGILAQEGYPAQADPKRIEQGVVVTILSLLMILAAMATAPLAALLAEIFPAGVRSTSANVAWQVGQAWFAGLIVPAAFALMSSSGILTQGLLYPVFFAALAVIVGGINLPNPRRLPEEA